MMLEEENSEIVSAGKLGDTTEEESSSVEETEEDIFGSFEEIIIFESEEYLFKITDVYLDYSNRCCVEMYFENRSNDKTYKISGNHWAINGIQCTTDWGDEVSANKTNTSIVCLKDGSDQMVGESKVSVFYSASEYTDIEIGFHLSYIPDEGDYEVVEEKFVHIYPKGEENAITFTRELQSSDIVLVDNENVSVIITGYEEHFVPGDTINVLIENKTNQYIRVKVEEALANGIAMDADNYFGVYNITVNPGAVAMYPMTLFDGRMDGWGYGDPDNTFFTKNNITSIEEIEMKLRISEYVYSVGTVEDYIYDTFKINP